MTESRHSSLEPTEDDFFLPHAQAAPNVSDKIGGALIGLAVILTAATAAAMAFVGF